MTAHLRGPCWLLLAISTLVIGCRSSAPQSAYYTLSSEPKALQSASGFASNLVIGIGAVDLPQYLDRPQVLLRTGSHQFRIYDDHLWAAPLAEEFARVLAENLMVLTRSPHVAHLPWPNRFKPDVVVALQVFNFEGDAEGVVRLRTAVRINDRRSSEEKSWIVDLQQKVPGSGFVGYATAQSDLIAELSRRIAEALPR